MLTLSFRRLAPRLMRGAGAALVALGLAYGVSATSAAVGASQSAPKRVTGQYVGAIPTTGAYVAVVADPLKRRATKRGVLVYVCDGQGLSAWFPGFAAGNVIDITSKGRHVHATVSQNRAVGTLRLGGGQTLHFVAGRATGLAGLYLVRHSIGQTEGASAAGFALRATVTQTGSSTFHINGTVTPHGGSSHRLDRTATFSGPVKKFSTWIIPANGEVKGEAKTPTNTAGGGNCSIWSKIKQLAFGVFCGFF
jgi:hypothetical protein